MLVEFAGQTSRCAALSWRRVRISRSYDREVGASQNREVAEKLLICGEIWQAGRAYLYEVFPPANNLKEQ